MSEDNKRFKLCIPNEESLSEFVIELIKEEADVIDAEISIEEGQITIKTAYIHELDDKIEVSFYVINNVNKAVNFEKLALSLVKDGVNVGAQIFESKELGDIPPKSIKYNTIYFNKENVKTEDFTDVQIQFVADEGYQAKSTTEVDLVNLPSTIKKNDLKVINDFLDKLPYLTVGTIDIHTFSVFYDEFKNLSIIIIIRNGYKTDAKLGALPIKVYDGHNNLVYGGVGTPNNVNIKSDTASIQHIIIKEQDVLIKDAEVSALRVEF